MTEQNEANAVLSDPKKRAAYDRIGRGLRAGQEFQPPPDGNAANEYSGDGMSAAEAARPLRVDAEREMQARSRCEVRIIMPK